MKASELIKHLNKLINKHGDIEVMITDNEFGDHYPVSKPKYCDSKKTFSFDDGNIKSTPEKIIVL